MSHRNTVAYIFLLFSAIFLWGNSARAASPLTAGQIYSAIHKGNTPAISTYLKQGYAIDVADTDGNTALCLAIQQGDKTAVQQLISMGANHQHSCVSKFSASDLTKVGLNPRTRTMITTTRQQSKQSTRLIPAVWKTKAALFLAAAGGIVGIAAIAGGGGGGGGGSIHFDPSKEPTNLDEETAIPAVAYVKSCPTGSGMVLLNGVCSCPNDKILVEGVCVDKTAENTPDYYAENGAAVKNTGNLVHTEGSATKLVAMQANGVSASSLKNGTVYLNGASSAFNAASGNIIMAEKSSTDGGLFGMYATAAGTINNDGSITITSLSPAESAAMKVDRNDQYEGLPGTGKNVNNNGTITVTKSGDGAGVLSAISAPGRGVTNNGTISLNLATTSYASETQHGTLQGLYGKNLVNKGTISLSTNPSASTVNADAFLLRGYGDKGSIVANDGKINIDLTNVAYGIYGIWSDKGTEVTVKNTGTVTVSGTLYKDPNISKQVYFLGSDSGISTVSNGGDILVGTKENPIDVSAGGIMDAMYLNQGTMTNDGNLDFHLKIDPDKSSGTFTSYAMELESGTLTNNQNINYSFTSKTEEPYTGIKPDLYLNGIEVASGTATNNADIVADLTGVANDGFYTAMNANSASLTNTQKIIANSDIDNLDLIGFKSSGGSITNSDAAIIDLTTTGNNADLIGGDTAQNTSAESGSANTGYIYLTHNGGSGNITGFSAANTGLIQIKADNMTGLSVIKGGKASSTVTETLTVEADIDETQISNEEGTTASEATKKAIGKINIALTGTTAGTVSGFDYLGTALEAPTHSSASTINISANSKTRTNSLTVYGLYTATTGRSERDDGIVSTNRDGILNLDVTGSSGASTQVYGLYANDANITNTNTSVVNLNINLNGSTNHFIAGMMAVDSAVHGTTADYYGGYKAYNAGTLNLDVKGKTATTSYIDSNIPFDVVGMATNSYAINTGTINLNVESDTAKTAGMVAYDGGIIINQGIIRFTGTEANFTPMYATGSRVLVEEEIEEGGTTTTTTTTTTNYYGTLYNSGKIVINSVVKSDSFTPKGQGYYTASTYDTNTPPNPVTGSSTAEDVWARDWTTVVETCEGGECTSEETDKGDTRGQFTPFSTTVSLKKMSLNSGMKYVTQTGGTLEAKGIHMMGDVTADPSLVTGGNLDFYLGNGQGEGALIGDGSYADLTLESGSVLFSATYQNNTLNPDGIDIALTRRSFDDVIEDKALANYLETNYTAGNAEAFFDTLKGFEDKASLSAGLDKAFGRDMLSRFAFEDMTLIRELNLDMNNRLFNNTENYFSTGATVATPIAFKNDSGSKSRYSLASRCSGDWSVGLGIAFTNTRSDDNHNSARSDSMYQMIVPIGYRAGRLQLVTSPRLGYARGTYDRVGLNNKTYDGTIEKRIFGLMNEARYPMTFGQWQLAPAVEFNALGYEQRGFEDAKAFRLNIPRQRTYSVESGFGLYATHESDLSRRSHLKLTAGLTAYHEFADPYRMTVGLEGLSGRMTLRDEDRSDNRAVARAGFTFDRGNYSLNGHIASYIDHEIRTKANLALKFLF